MADTRGRAWGPTVGRTLGWVLMESPAVVGKALCWALGGNDLVGTVFLAAWMAHYVHRAFVYPLRRRVGARAMPIIASRVAPLRGEQPAARARRLG
jgi:hypothetical protein